MIECILSDSNIATGRGIVSKHTHSNGDVPRIIIFYLEISVMPDGIRNESFIISFPRVKTLGNNIGHAYGIEIEIY